MTGRSLEAFGPATLKQNDSNLSYILFQSNLPFQDLDSNITRKRQY